MQKSCYYSTNKRNDKTKLKWSDETCEAFWHCKQSLANAAILLYPAAYCKISMMVDASDNAIGAGKDNIIVFKNGGNTIK